MGFLVCGGKQVVPAVTALVVVGDLKKSNLFFSENIKSLKNDHSFFRNDKNDHSPEPSITNMTILV